MIYSSTFLWWYSLSIYVLVLFNNNGLQQKADFSNIQQRILCSFLGLLFPWQIVAVLFKLPEGVLCCCVLQEKKKKSLWSSEPFPETRVLHYHCLSVRVGLFPNLPMSLAPCTMCSTRPLSVLRYRYLWWYICIVLLMNLLMVNFSKKSSFWGLLEDFMMIDTVNNQWKPCSGCVLCQDFKPG